MKKIFAVILVCLISLTNIATVSADSILDDPIHSYETSTGAYYTFDDFDIYVEDFEGVTIETEQEFIDHIYNVGTERIENEESSDYDSDYDSDNGPFSKLTTSQLELLISNLFKNILTEDWYIEVVCNSKDISEKKTDFYYGAGASDDDNEVCNAFKHAFWTMYLCQHTSPEFALAFTTAHEDRENNNELSKIMDLTNNQISYDYFLENLTESNLTDDELAELVKSKVDNGDYIYIIKNHTYVTRIIYLPSSSTPHYEHETRSFYAYTNSTTPFNVPDPEVVYLPYLPLNPGDQVLRPNDTEKDDEVN